MKYIQIISCTLSLINLTFTDGVNTVIPWKYNFKDVVDNNDLIEETEDSGGQRIFTFYNHVGDDITWDFDGFHNLIEVTSLDEWLSCNGTDGVGDATPNDNNINTIFAQQGSRYFICTAGGPKNNHCMGGQRLIVTTSPTFPVNVCSVMKKKDCKKAKMEGLCKNVKKKRFSCVSSQSKRGKKREKKRKRICKTFVAADKTVDVVGCTQKRNAKKKLMCEVKLVPFPFCIMKPMKMFP